MTDKIEYGEENVPASMWPMSPESFSRVPPVADPRCTANATTQPSNTSSTDPDRIPWMRFEVRVFDANIDDTLRARMFINRKRTGSGSLNAIPRTGNEDRGVVQVCLPKSALKRPCNHVEFVVSRGFSETSEDDYAPELEDDFAKVEWWVLGPASDYSEVTATDCELGLPDGGVP